MRRFLVRAAFTALAPATAFSATAVHAEDFEPRVYKGSYTQVLEDVVAMVGDNQAQQLAAARGLNIVNVTWEDTGRYKGSSVGPNISDMTIQVQHKQPNGKHALYLMPVIRSPNFGDVTADIPMERFNLLVGNERGKGLRRVNLREFLGNIREYLHEPGSWKGERQSLLADKRDSHALVSAQAAFLPIPKQGEAKFNPVLFNYQSMKGDPAVMTILVTREGTSVTIIDNTRDGFDAGGVWGQRLFFNANGQRASLTGKRLSEIKLEPSTKDPVQADANGQAGMNMVLLIQVPLKQKNPMRFDTWMAEGAMDDLQAAPTELRRTGGSDVENAAIGHGELEGEFTEIDDLDIERDDRFPVRVTVQFYKATSNGVVSEADLDGIKQQIDEVYADATYVGSLVTAGETGRVTEYDGDKTEPPDWWQKFWQRNQQNTGLTRDQVLWQMKVLYRPFFVADPWFNNMRLDD